MNYYLVRYFISYMLFSGKKSNSKSFVKYYCIYKKWFEENKISSNISPFSFKLKGENFKNRMIVGIFLLLDKINCITLFSKIYCKGKEE